MTFKTTFQMNLKETKNNIPLIKHIPGPHKIRRLLSRQNMKSVRLRYLMHHNKRKYADYLFKKKFGYSIDWKHPRDLNEWINYLAFKTDTTEWSRLADKYEVRNFVAERGLSKILLPLYGKWNKASDIDFDILPDSFVLKTNSGCGDTIIVKDKRNADLKEIIKKIDLAMAQRDTIFLRSAEPHYLKIGQMVICEKLISPPPIEYKFYCFDGEPFCVLTCSNRDLEKHTVDWMLYDLDWNRRLDWMMPAFRKDIEMVRPNKLEEMIEYAKILSKGFPHVRVDLYQPDNNVYFGEMTFTSTASRIDWCEPAILRLMGDKVGEALGKKSKQMSSI